MVIKCEEGKNGTMVLLDDDDDDVDTDGSIVGVAKTGK